ncbi:glutamate receptor 4-like [Stylophora pistillata]|uniref:glutamate receptor 4-like n=1 Tax=Stylophora pistillata TaxID=50429 RepID=UPI000C0419F7|nr:glutamate receptor 4-like [Stylophora pistillata]
MGVSVIRLHGSGGKFDQCERAVDMSAGYRYFAHATFDVLNILKWRRLLLIFDESRFVEAGYFYLNYKKSTLTMDLIQMAETKDAEDRQKKIWQIIGQIQSYQPEGILLYTGKENTDLILQQVPCQRHFPYQWILQEQVSQNQRSIPDHVVLAFKLPFKSSFVDKHFGSSEQGKFKSTNKLKVKFNGMTGSVQFDDSGNRKDVCLEILNLQNGSFQKIGWWNSTKRAVLYKDPLPNTLPGSSSNGELKGRHFRIVYVKEPPFIMPKENEDGTNSLQGYSIDLLKELSRLLGFTYEMYPSPDGFYGALTENGTWNGMIGEIINGNANMAAAPVTITETREKVVDFTVPYMYYTDDLLVKKTSTEATDLLQFMDPFENGVWIATLGVVALFSVVVFVLNYYSPYGYKDENGRGTSEEFNFFNSVWFSVACMLQQGGDRTPRNLSGRILTGCYWLCILVWVSTYTANLAAFLTVKNAAEPINNLNDILKTSYKLAVVSSTSVSATFRTTQYQPHMKIWKRVQADKTLVKSAGVGVQWVREKDNFAFIYDGPVLRYFAMKRPCDLRVVPGLTTAKGFALTFRAHDPHTDKFTLTILHLHENQFLDSLKRKWWDDANFCSQDEDTTLSRKRLSLKSMLGVYVVLSAGVAVALVTLMAEIYWKRKAERTLANKVRTGNRRPTIPALESNYARRPSAD